MPAVWTSIKYATYSNELCYKTVSIILINKAQLTCPFNRFVTQFVLLYCINIYIIYHHMTTDVHSLPPSIWHQFALHILISSKFSKWPQNSPGGQSKMEVNIWRESAFWVTVLGIWPWTFTRYTWGTHEAHMGHTLARGEQAVSKGHFWGTRMERAKMFKFSRHISGIHGVHMGHFILLSSVQGTLQAHHMLRCVPQVCLRSAWLNSGI